MKTMQVNESVDALVEYKEGRAFPVLRAIKWQGRRVDFATRPKIERATNTLLYRFDEGLTRYGVRFEVGRQRWFLEGIDDSGITDFPPPAWRRGE